MLTINVDSTNVTCTRASLPKQMLKMKLFTMHFAMVDLGNYGFCEDNFFSKKS